MPYELVLLKNIHDPRVKEIDRYIELGGYQTAEKVVKEITPKDVIETTKATGLRGRGGAGFPTGLKWSFVPKDTGKPVYLCCNADESEPGTCKDRVIIERDPHQLIEGIIIAAYAVEWFKSIGSNEKNTGPKLYCVSGQVNKPAVVERELGIPLMELINDVCGGVRNGNKLKGIIPGGSSVPILRPEECDVRMDFDSTAEKGTLIGSW